MAPTPVLTFRDGSPATVFSRNQRTGSIQRGSEPLFDPRTQEINASNMRQWAQQLADLSTAIQSSDVNPPQHQADAEAQQMRTAALQAIRGSYDTPEFKVVGEALTDEIWETMNREGFTGKLLGSSTLGTGDIARIKIRKKDVAAYVVTADPITVESQVFQYWVYPDEYLLTAYVLIDDREAEQAGPELFDEKYQDGLENVMVAEDRLTRTLINNLADSFNSVQLFSNMPPSVVATMMTDLQGWGLQTANLLMAADLWVDIATNSDFVSWFDPVSQHEIVTTGRIRTMLGFDIITDAYRYPNLKVLNAGEAYALAAPQTLGAIMRRKEPTPTAINRYNDGIPMRGWFIEGMQAHAVTNGRAISRALRA